MFTLRSGHGIRAPDTHKRPCSHEWTASGWAGGGQVTEPLNISFLYFLNNFVQLRAAVHGAVGGGGGDVRLVCPLHSGHSPGQAGAEAERVSPALTPAMQLLKCHQICCFINKDCDLHVPTFVL